MSVIFWSNNVSFTAYISTTIDTYSNYTIWNQTGPERKVFTMRQSDPNF